MLLYTFMSSYQLLECIENKLLYHKNEDAILMVYPFALDKFPHYRTLVENGIFYDAFVFESGRIDYSSNDKSIADQFESVYNDGAKIPLKEINDFIVYGAHMPITIYLIENGISFEVGEDGSGAYSRPDLLYEIEKASFGAKFEVMNSYGLYNLQTLDYPFIKRIYYNKAGQKDGYISREKIKVCLLLISCPRNLFQRKT